MLVPTASSNWMWMSKRLNPKRKKKSGKRKSWKKKSLQLNRQRRKRKALQGVFIILDIWRNVLKMLLSRKNA